MLERSKGRNQTKKQPTGPPVCLGVCDRMATEPLKNEVANTSSEENLDLIVYFLFCQNTVSVPL